MEHIPDDVMKAAEMVWLHAYAALDVPHPPDGHDAATLVIARAILADREKAKTHWLAWHAKRTDIASKHWLRASKAALSGDMRELRNRVDLAEASPVEIVLSDA